LLQFTENYLTERMVYRMFFLGRNFVSGLICMLKSKKPKNFFPKKPRFFQPYTGYTGSCNNNNNDKTVFKCFMTII